MALDATAPGAGNQYCSDKCLWKLRRWLPLDEFRAALGEQLMLIG